MTSQRRSLSDAMPQEKGLRSPAVSPKRALPASLRTRRKFPGESEDDSGVLLIEQYIYRRNRFRSTSLAFPFPAPMIPSELEQEERGLPVISWRTCVISCAISSSGVVCFCLPYIVSNALKLTRRVPVFGTGHMNFFVNFFLSWVIVNLSVDP